MSLETKIKSTITEALKPEYLEVHNDSKQHATNSDDSHFRLLIVSTCFADVPLIKRHKMVYESLATTMKIIHALSMQTYTPKEWQDAHTKKARTPPPCSKKGN